MATLNLGRLKPVFRGSWNNATAYSVDDIVVRNNQSYISIQAGTNQDPATATAYWTLMAAKGVDGDNFGLANKEIAFKTNAGALDGIPIGTANQFLKVNSGATGYEFGAVSSDYVKLASADVTSGSSFNINGYFSTDYRVFKIFMNHANTWHKARFNFGSSYTTYGGSNYVNSLDYAQRVSGSNGGGNSGNWNSDSMFTTYWNGDGNQEHANAEITIFRPWDTNYAKNIQVISWDYNSSELHITNSTAYLDANKYDEAVTGIYIFPASGSIGETQWALYGIK